LPNGIPGKVLENPRLPRERIEQKLLSSKIELLFVGRINRLKGFDLVKEIVTFLDHKFSELAIPSTALHVVGKITSEGRRLLENWQCKNVEVNVYGHIEDTQLNELYQRCAFCLFLSRNEGFGLPVIESVWFGCVPVLSKIAIFEELMGDDFSFFVHNDDIGSRVYHFMMRLRYDEEFRRGILDIMERALDKHEKGYQAAASIVAELCREKWQWDSLPDDRLDNGSRSERAPFVTVGGQGGRGQNLEKYEC
jgi:glycosyltransferase involved in cell wall biosynthesis